MTDTTDTPTPRHDGWTPEKQCIFLEALADHGHVRRACKRAGMSHESAYQLRRRREGAAFQLGWDAALLLARTGLGDTLMERALDGQDDMIVREDDGRTRTRTRHDNRLALALLARLDRLADDEHIARADARTAMNDWQAFLELVAQGGDADATDDFLCARRPHRKRLFGPCQLHEAGVEPDDTDQQLCDSYDVWFDELAQEHRTNFPPPPGFDGFEVGDPDRNHSDYERSLTAREEAHEVAFRASETAKDRARAETWRRQWFEIEDEPDDETNVQYPDADAPCSEAAETVS